MFICQYCGRHAKTKNSNTQHEIRCKENPAGAQIKPSYGMLGKKGANQYTYGAEMSGETKRKISKANRMQVWTDERRAAHSKSMRKAVERNPDSYTKNNVCGRVKMIEYNGVNLKGSWEVKTARWLDSIGVRWKTKLTHSHICGRTVGIYIFLTSICRITIFTWKSKDIKLTGTSLNGRHLAAY